MVIDRQVPVQPEQHAEPDHRGDEAADQLHQAGADQVPDALGVAHDARHQHAGLRRVEVAHRQAHDVRLHALAHVGDRALRGDAEDLRQRKRRDRLHERGGASRQRDPDTNRFNRLSISIWLRAGSGRATSCVNRLISISVRTRRGARRGARTPRAMQGERHSLFLRSASKKKRKWGEVRWFGPPAADDVSDHRINQERNQGSGIRISN